MVIPGLSLFQFLAMHIAMLHLKIHSVCLRIDLLVEIWSQLDSCHVTRLHLVKFVRKRPSLSQKKKFIVLSPKKVNKKMYMEYSITFLGFSNQTQSKICNKYPLSEAATLKSQYSLKMENFETNSLITNESTSGLLVTPMQSMPMKIMTCSSITTATEMAKSL